MGIVLILAEKPSQGAAYADSFEYVKRKDGYFEVQDNQFFNGTAYITWGFGRIGATGTV